MTREELPGHVRARLGLAVGFWAGLYCGLAAWAATANAVGWLVVAGFVFVAGLLVFLVAVGRYR